MRAKSKKVAVQWRPYEKIIRCSLSRSTARWRADDLGDASRRLGNWPPYPLCSGFRNAGSVQRRHRYSPKRANAGSVCAVAWTERFHAGSVRPVARSEQLHVGSVRAVAPITLLGSFQLQARSG